MTLQCFQLEVGSELINKIDPVLIFFFILSFPFFFFFFFFSSFSLSIS